MSQRSVLLVDDEAALRRIVATTFEQHGYLVIESDNGVDGYREALARKPDLIILDLLMPGMNGYEVCRKIRANQSGYKPVIIITSAKSYKPDMDKALEAGANAFFVKPADMDELLKTADDELRKHNKVGR